MNGQVLERFHRALLEEIQTQRPEYLTGPFTVAEIYQNLVPYGSHRDRIGVEMNGDYEDALLRLLAGEGGFLILDSEHAVRDIQAELDSGNPNTALYRDFAAVDVRLNQSSLDLSAAAVDEITDLAEELDAESPVSMYDLAPGSDGGSELELVPPGVDIFDDEHRPTSDGAESEPTGEPEFAGDMYAADAPASEHEPVMATLAELANEPAPEATDASPREAVADLGSTEEEAPPAPPAGGLQPEFVEPTQPAAVDGGACRWCRAELPQRENLNFCPFCGTDLNLVPCGSCGEELEASWRFCIACGAAAPTS